MVIYKNGPEYKIMKNLIMSLKTGVVQLIINQPETQPGLHSRGAVKQRAQPSSFNGQHLHLFILPQEMVYGLAEVAAPRAVLEEPGGWELRTPPNIRPP